MAKRGGATHVVNSSKDDPVNAVRALTGGAGVDHAFEAVGNATLVRQAIESLAIRGTATIVGVLPADAMIEFPWLAIRPECRVQTSRMGSNRFRIDIPRYLELYRQGWLARASLGKLGVAPVEGEHIRIATDAHRVGVGGIERVVPRPRRELHHARAHGIAHDGAGQAAPAVIEHAYDVPAPDAAPGRV